MINKHDKPLAQLVRRIHESDNWAPVVVVKAKNVELKHSHSSGPILECVASGVQYRKVILNSFILQRKPPNNCVLLNNSDIALIRNIVELNDKVYILCQIFLSVSNFFTHPWPSSLVSIFTVKSDLSSLKLFPLDSIKNKVVLVKSSETSRFAVELLHHS